MRQLRAVILASLLCCLSPALANAQDTTLKLGAAAIERQLGAGQSQTFTITVDENTLVQLVVDQQGIDVIVRIATPDGKTLPDFDTPNGNQGPENVSFVALTAGAYRVTVSPLNESGDLPTGRFQIRVIEQREATEQEIKTSKNLEVVKAKGIALLGDVEGMIAELHSPQTRIRAQLQTSQLLWGWDEKRATKYFNDAIAGLKEVIAALDVNDSDYSTKHSWISALRFEIAQLLVGRDPDAAFSFIKSTRLPGSPYGNDREEASQESGLELQIATHLAGTDPKRTLDIARQQLKKGYSPNLMNTLASLRPEHKDLAAQLANDIASKLLGEELLKQGEAAGFALSMMHMCRYQKKEMPEANGQGEQAPEPLLSESMCRELLQKVFKEATSKLPATMPYSPGREASMMLLSGLQSLGADLDAYVTGGQASVEKKLIEFNTAFNPQLHLMQQFQNTLNNKSPEAALESVEKAPEEMREQLYMQLSNQALASGDGARARQIINEHISNPFQRNQALANIQQQELFQSMSKGKTEEALRAIAALRTPRDRAVMLGQIARQIGPGQKRATALNLLEQARAMLGPSPQAGDQEQMNALLEIARAFSRYDSKRAFEIVDPLVDQLNDICAAARTMEGFGPEYFDEDELDLQNGSSVANMASQVSSALASLAIVNFERAKASSDRLRLPEVRLRAYLEIATQTIQGTNYSSSALYLNSLNR
jgi:hypothetical protein